MVWVNSSVVVINDCSGEMLPVSSVAGVFVKNRPDVIGVNEGVGEGGTGVEVGVLVSVGVGVWVGVGVEVGVLVDVLVGVTVEVGVAFLVGVLVAVGVEASALNSRD